jgi:hypothetical protein
MFRKIIAGTAVAGALTFGMAGIAGAATTSTPTGTPSAALCAKAAKVEARIQTFEAQVNARIPKAEAREATARAAGHTKVADFIANRITKVQARETKLNARLAKIEAKCGTAGATGSAVG